MSAPARRSSSPRARELVRAAVRSPGAPLAAAALTDAQQRLGHDFGSVRVHADDRAAASALAVGARAYAAGGHVVFGRSQYRPHTSTGRDLIVHELTHVLQQDAAPAPAGLELGPSDDLAEREAESASARRAGGRPARVTRTCPRISRQIYEELKEAAYSALIEGLRVTRESIITMQRASISQAPAALQPTLNVVVDVLDGIMAVGAQIAIAVVGLIVGFAEGVVGMIVGLVQLAIGLLRGIGALLADIWNADGFSRSAAWWNGLIETLRNIPAGLQLLYDDWLARFNAAPTDRRVAMIAERFGPLLAFIATFYVPVGAVGEGAATAGRVGEVAAAAGRTAEVAGAAGRTAEAVGTAGRVAEVGGAATQAPLRLVHSVPRAEVVAEAAAAPAVTGGAARGNLALRVAEEAAPLATPIPVPPPLRLLPPVAAPVPEAVAPAVSMARRVAAPAAGAAGALRTIIRVAGDEREKPKEDEKDRPRMRHQIQRDDDHLSSATVVAADSVRGVTAREYRDCMQADFNNYMALAGSRGKVSRPREYERPIRSGIISQSQQIPVPGGLNQLGDINALRYCFSARTLAPIDCGGRGKVRLDVEILAGANNLQFDV